MGYPIFHSQYTAAQIEASLGKTPRIKASTRTWEIWDIATSQYVDTGVSIDTQLFVDPTLTESGYAADAKVTGDKIGEVKSAINDITGNSLIAMTTGAYIATNGVSADISNPTTNASYAYGVVDCSPGDKFTISGKAGGTPRLWAFINTNDGNKVLARSDNISSLVTDVVIKAPANATKLVINELYSDLGYVPASYVGEVIRLQEADRVADIADIRDSLGITSVQFLDGYITTPTAGNTVNLTPVSSNTVCYALVDCNAGDAFVITGTPNDNTGTRAYMFCYNDGTNWISLGRYDGTSPINRMEIVAPRDGKLVVNFLKGQTHILMTGHKDVNDSLTEAENDIKTLESYNSAPLTSFPGYVFNHFTKRKLSQLDKAYICLTTDDGTEDGTTGIATYTIPLAIAKGVPFTFALWSTSQVFSSETYTNTLLDAIENHGCAVAQHGNNSWPQLTETGLIAFFDSEKAFFDSKGIEVKSAVCPAHRINDMVRAVAGGRFGVVRSGYAGGKNTDNTYGPSDYVYNYYDYYVNGPQSNVYGLTSFNISSRSLQASKDALDYAVANKFLVITLFHEFELDADKKANIEAFIDYAKTKDIKFITLDQIPYLPTIETMHG